MIPKKYYFVLPVLGLALSGWQGAYPVTLDDVALRAVASPGTPRLEDVLFLRDRGQAAVDALTVVATRNGIHGPRYADLLDTVCAQKDCSYSTLYWHTDLEKAKAEAVRSGRPILSLRLLGKLTDELSCANSRFFRTVLYPNKEVSKLLREQFVLHWSSERPVPVTTIDFGDGRKIQTTFTGNSVHYIFDSSGRVLDALPGLYTPGMFIERLNDVHDLSTRLARESGPRWSHALANFHASRRWDIQLAKLTNRLIAGIAQPKSRMRVEASPPTAADAATMGIAKALTEKDLFRAAGKSVPAILEIPPGLKEKLKVEELLDEKSMKVFQAKLPPGTGDAERLRIAKNFVDSALMDAVGNEYGLHLTIHQMFGEPSSSPLSWEQLNTKIYADVFLTPRSDSWLGLYPDSYTGVQNAGLFGSSPKIP